MLSFARPLRGFACLAVFTLVSCLVGTARATVVVQSSIEELVDASDVVVHGVIQRVNETNAPGVSRLVSTVAVDVLEVLKGLPPDSQSIRLVLPGGIAGERRMLVPGMPRFNEGDEVVMLLERTRFGFTPAGLSRGVFKVRRSSGGTLAQRDTSGLAQLVKRPGGGVLSELPDRESQPFESLLAYLRGLCGESR
jgi:hypothetical protein